MKGGWEELKEALLHGYPVSARSVEPPRESWCHTTWGHIKAWEDWRRANQSNTPRACLQRGYKRAVNQS